VARKLRKPCQAVTAGTKLERAGAVLAGVLKVKELTAIMHL
jgi:hypothetical protein